MEEVIAAAAQQLEQVKQTGNEAVAATTANMIDAAQSLVSDGRLGSLPVASLSNMLSKIGSKIDVDARAVGATAAEAGGQTAAGSASTDTLDAEQLPGAWKALATVAGKVCAAETSP